MPDSTPTDFPVARANDLVAETIGAETVVYDGLTKEAHCLAPLAAAVFAASDGRTSPVDLAAVATAKLVEPVDVDAVELALAELEEHGLIEPPQGEGMSRRNLLRRGALVGGAALAAPLVASLVTPEYGAASSLSSLSYVVLVWNSGGTNGTYYRAKWQAGSAIFGWSFATPGTDCEFTTTHTESDNGIAGLNVTESTNGSGQTLIQVSWTDATKTLVDVRIKCANDCHVVSGVTGTSPSPSSGGYVGCP